MHCVDSHQENLSFSIKQINKFVLFIFVVDDGLYSEHRMVRARSLSKINSSVAPRQIYLDTSEEEDMFRYPVYQLPPRRRSRASSQENIHQGPPPVWLKDF